jgi:hypothetical protein
MAVGVRLNYSYSGSAPIFLTVLQTFLHSTRDEKGIEKCSPAQLAKRNPHKVKRTKVAYNSRHGFAH